MKKFAVVGSPIKHSLSPTLHQAVFTALNLDHSYVRRDIQLGHLASVIAEFDGVSITMPLKEEAFNLAQSLDHFATQTGAVNTLVRTDDSWQGFNTDVSGLKTLFVEHGLTDLDYAQVIGSGATARSALVALQGVANRVEVIARNSNAELPGNPKVCPWGSALNADLVISTVPSGVADSLLSGSGTLIDVVYAPWPTAIAARWDGRVISGLEMLIHQAAQQSRLFLAPLEIDLDEVRTIMRSALDR